MASEEELDALWMKYVGSHHMHWKDELKVLRGLAREKKLPWQTIRSLYYTTQFWDVVRNMVLMRDGYRCVVCGSKVALHVDHIKYGKVLGDERTELLQTLCRECHVKKTKRFDLEAGAVPKAVRKRVEVRSDEELYMVMR